MAEVLYGAVAASASTSNLYTVDPTTGALSTVGPIGFAITGLAVDPTTGLLYGVTSNNSAAHPHSFISIDTATGAGTFIVSYASNAGLTDIAFDASGVLYGARNSSPPALVTVNLTTGAQTLVGAFSDSPNGPGSLFLTGGGLTFVGSTLYLVNGSPSFLFQVNPSDGSSVVLGGGSGVSLTPNLSGPIGAMATRPSDNTVFGAIASNKKFLSIDPIGLTDSLIATFSVQIDGLAWAAEGGGPTSNFSLEVDPLSLHRGASGITSAISTLSAGADDTATLTYSGAPAGVTLTFSNGFLDEDGGFDNFTVDVDSSVSPGVYSITVTGTDSDESVDADFELTVLDDDFSLSLSTFTMSFTADGAQTAILNVNELGGPMDVSLSAAQDITFGQPWPTQVTYSLTPSLPTTVTTPASVAVQITVAAGAPSGSYRLKFTGVGDSGTHTVTLVVTVSGTETVLRDALEDISCITSSLANSGLSALSGDWVRTPNLGEIGDGSGMLELNGDLVAWWLTNSSNPRVSVARYSSGAWTYLGEPFATGASTISYAQSRYTSTNGAPNILQIDYQGAQLVTDGVDIYCLTAVRVADYPDDQGWDVSTGWDSMSLWKLACKRWESGTVWSDYGWDDCAVMSGSAVKNTQNPDANTTIGSASYTGSVQTSRSLGAAANAGNVYATWCEDGVDFDVIHTGPFWDIFHTSSTYDTGYHEEWSARHFCTFTGPGKTADSHVVKTLENHWDGVTTTAPNYILDSNLITPETAVVGAQSTPIAIIVGTNGDPGNPPFFQMYNVSTGSLISSSIPSGVATDDVLTQNGPRQLFWDETLGCYLTVLPSSTHMPAPFAADYWRQIFTLDETGTTWGVLQREGADLPLVGNSTFPDHSGAWLVGVEDVNVWLVDDTRWTDGLVAYQSIFAWIPCETGPFDQTAWRIVDVGQLSPNYNGFRNYSLLSDVLTISGTPSPSAGPYVPPDPSDSTGSWLTGFSRQKSLKIGSHIYVLTTETPHAPYDTTSGHTDARVYDFMIGRNEETSCPSIIVSSTLPPFFVTTVNVRR